MDVFCIGAFQSHGEGDQPRACRSPSPHLLLAALKRGIGWWGNQHPFSSDFVGYPRVGYRVFDDKKKHVEDVLNVEDLTKVRKAVRKVIVNHPQVYHRWVAQTIKIVVLLLFY